MSNLNSPSVITFTLAAGSTASPYFGMVNVTTRLCTKVCRDTGFLFSPVVSLASLTEVGTGQYMATFTLSGTYSYTKCGDCCCNAIIQIVNQKFTVPIYSSTAPTSVTAVLGTAVNAVAVNDCQTCGRIAVTECPLTLTVA